LANGNGVQHRETSRHKAAFEQFYASERDCRKVAEAFAVSQKTAQNWADWFDWRAQADRRDREAAEKADRDAIRRRAAMLTTCRQAGELMVMRGVERLRKGALETDGAALSAITRGIEVWRTAEGLPTWLLGVLNGTEDDLERTYRELDERRRAAMVGGPTPAGGTEILPALPGGAPDGEERPGTALLPAEPDDETSAIPGNGGL